MTFSLVNQNKGYKVLKKTVLHLYVCDFIDSMRQTSSSPPSYVILRAY